MARRLSFHAFLNLKRQSALSWLCGDAGQREAGSFHAFLNLKRQSALSWLCGDAGQREAGSLKPVHIQKIGKLCPPAKI
jgi:hypothetical protein